MTCPAVGAAARGRALATAGNGRALGAAALIGAVSGLRSQLGLACVAATTAPRALPGAAAALAGPAGRAVTAALAAGEVAADKWPSAPDRRSPLALGLRALTGAGAAAALTARGPARATAGEPQQAAYRDACPAGTARSTGRPALAVVAAAAAVGGAAAVGAACLGARWRLADSAAGHPDWPAALAEDAAALALAWTATGGARARTAAGSARSW